MTGATDQAQEYSEASGDEAGFRELLQRVDCKDGLGYKVRVHSSNIALHSSPVLLYERRMSQFSILYCMRNARSGLRRHNPQESKKTRERIPFMKEIMLGE